MCLESLKTVTVRELKGGLSLPRPPTHRLTAQTPPELHNAAATATNMLQQHAAGLRVLGLQLAATCYFINLIFLLLNEQPEWNLIKSKTGCCNTSASSAESYPSYNDESWEWGEDGGSSCSG